MSASAGGPPLATLALLLGGCFQDGGEVTSATDGDPTASASSTAGDGGGSTSTGATTASTSTSATTSTAGSGGEDTSAASTGDATSTSTGAPMPAVCGNGIHEPGEECDDGEANGPEAPCSDDCVKGYCGDAIVQPGLGEECDLGAELNHENGACTDLCADAVCGDGKVFAGVEECDDGEDNQAGLYGGCTPMTCTFGPHCGDQALQKPEEECDLGAEKNGLQGEACTSNCSLAGKMIFVTSKLYTGKIGAGGALAADDACNTAAMEAGIANAGKFKAWISDADGSPKTWPQKPAGPFILPGAQGVVAASWTDLTDGSLGAKIDVREDGAKLEDFKRAWTGTAPDGAAQAARCLDWKDGSKDQSGVWGSLEAVDGAWSSSATVGCQWTARLICVET